MERKASKTRLFHTLQDVTMLLTPLLVLISVLLLPLLEHGLINPLGSIRAQKEIRAYLDERYPGETLRITFPKYNFVNRTFSGRIRDGEDTWLMGVTYAPDGGTLQEWDLTEDGKHLIRRETEAP